jgi:hypothetical protein
MPNNTVSLDTLGRRSTMVRNDICKNTKPLLGPRLINSLYLMKRGCGIQRRWTSQRVLVCTELITESHDRVNLFQMWGIATEYYIDFRARGICCSHEIKNVIMNSRSGLCWYIVEIFGLYTNIKANGRTVPRSNCLRCLFIHVSALASHLQAEYTIFLGSYLTHNGRR